MFIEKTKMIIRALYAKLHNAICTESRLDYMGSVTVDQDWLDAAGLHDGQAVDVLNIDNGARLTTYLIAGEPGLGEVCLNGSAAHHFEPGQKVIIIAYCYLTLEEKKDFRPKVLLFNEHPPFEIDQKAQKVKWLKEKPSYSLLEVEKPATIYPRNSE